MQGSDQYVFSGYPLNGCGGDRINTILQYRQIPGVLPSGICLSMSKPVSRILSWTAIYLGPSLPMGSSHLLRAAGQACCSPTVLLRIEFTAAVCLQPPGELLPRLSTLTRCCVKRQRAVYFCCTCPEVAFGGRYPLSLPCGARTFLVRGLSAHLPRLSGSLTFSF